MQKSMSIGKLAYFESGYQEERGSVNQNVQSLQGNRKINYHQKRMVCNFLGEEINSARLQQRY